MVRWGEDSNVQIIFVAQRGFVLSGSEYLETWKLGRKTWSVFNGP